jgi:4-hydroxy-tetrahydrodipicolinate synthase
MFCEASPAPAKFGASVLGHCTDEVRLPLVPATDAARTRIREAMAHAGIA